MFKRAQTTFVLWMVTAPIFAQDVVWMQKVLTNWDSICRHDLRIEPLSPPWIILYDSKTSWHINPREAGLPAHKKLPVTVPFAGKDYPIIAIEHDGKLWVPDRDKLDVSSLPAACMPYENNKSAYFIAPVRSHFRTLAPSDQAYYLDLMLEGLYGHELTHSRQLMWALPQILAAQKKYKLPESIDDNTIESKYKQEKSYVAMFESEKSHLWKAAMSPDIDSCILELKKALAVADERKRKFFTGKDQGYSKLDDIFLALEGSAMWVQLQVTLRSVPSDQPPMQTLDWLMQRTESWTQEEGLALFLIINWLVPNWQEQFFNHELPSPFEVLRKAAANADRK